MKTLKLNKKTHRKVLKETAGAIKNGKVVVCPTDTVYGLVCDATNKKAVERLYKIKKRPRRKPIPIFVKDIKMAKKLAYINKEQEKFLKKVWPGAVTVVLPARNGGSTIGIRVPKHDWLLGLAEQLNRPLAETSANISGRPASTKIKEVLKPFGNQKYKPDLVIDAGNLKKSKPSKVFDLTIWPPKILRQ